MKKSKFIRVVCIFIIGFIVSCKSSNIEESNNELLYGEKMLDNIQINKYYYSTGDKKEFYYYQNNSLLKIDSFYISGELAKQINFTIKTNDTIVKTSFFRSGDIKTYKLVLNRNLLYFAEYYINGDVKEIIRDAWMEMNTNIPEINDDIIFHASMFNLKPLHKVQGDLFEELDTPTFVKGYSFDFDENMNFWKKNISIEKPGNYTMVLRYYLDESDTNFYFNKQSFLVVNPEPRHLRDSIIGEE